MIVSGVIALIAISVSMTLNWSLMSTSHGLIKSNSVFFVLFYRLVSPHVSSLALSVFPLQIKRTMLLSNSGNQDFYIPCKFYSFPLVSPFPNCTRMAIMAILAAEALLLENKKNPVEKCYLPVRIVSRPHNL